MQRDGIALGTGRKLSLAQQLDLAPGVRSTLSGVLTLEAAPASFGQADPAIKRGFVRWELHTGAGYHGVLGVLGDRASSSIHGSFEAPLPGALAVSVSGVMRQTRTAWGPERVDSGNLELRRQFAHQLVVQPGMSLVDVHAGAGARWMGTSLRLEWRGAEFLARHEQARGSHYFSRKAWRTGGLRFTLGGQVERLPTRRGRGLLEVGVAGGGIGVSLFPGTEQRAILLQAGPCQLGFGARPAGRETVVGFKNLSFSCLQHPDRRREFGIGFVFRGLWRNVQRTPAAWQWRAPLPASVASQAPQRWPGIASLL